MRNGPYRLIITAAREETASGLIRKSWICSAVKLSHGFDQSWRGPVERAARVNSAHSPGGVASTAQPRSRFGRSSRNSAGRGDLGRRSGLFSFNLYPCCLQFLTAACGARHGLAAGPSFLADCLLFGLAHYDSVNATENQARRCRGCPQGCSPPAGGGDRWSLRATLRDERGLIVCERAHLVCLNG